MSGYAAKYLPHSRKNYPIGKNLFMSVPHMRIIRKKKKKLYVGA